MTDQAERHCVMGIAQARQLRKTLTDAERKLWSKLRYRQLAGFRFRRQVPIVPFVIDFACLSRRLLIELDGGQHATQQLQDGERTDWLEARGYRVLRFWNTDVLLNIDGILEVIHGALLEATPHCANG